MDTRFVGLVGKIGPAFTSLSSSGSIKIAEPESDSSWSISVPGDYFALSFKERLRAAFDHLVSCE